MKTFLFLTILIALIIYFISGCENIERFYRPNLPENLCCIGIIDADDTLRYISFEKSFQREYSEELNDSLREFSFSISSSDKELITFQSEAVIKELRDLKIPDSIAFNTDNQYYIRAKEKNVPEISAEVIVPKPPSELNLLSIHNEITTLSEPQECIGVKIVINTVLDLSFNNNNENMYYALLLEDSGFSLSSSSPFTIQSLLDFNVRDCNSPGFLAVMHGLKMYHWKCFENHLTLLKSPVFAYFINGKDISGNLCNIKISTKFSDDYSVFVLIRSLRIKLLSIPEELYHFEKSLYTYKQTSGDPFSEPVYLNGNIKGGNGVFAICRSTQNSINVPLPVF